MRFKGSGTWSGCPSACRRACTSRCKKTLVKESGHLNFDGIRFMPGAVAGVVAAALAADGRNVVVQTGSGSYAFATAPA